MNELDPTIFERYAQHLVSRAGGVVKRWTVAATLLGAALGAVTLTSWANWPVPHREAPLAVLLAAFAFGVVGRSIGTSRAASLRFQAQLVEHQHQFERIALSGRRAQAAVYAQAATQPSAPAGVPPVSAPVISTPPPPPAAAQGPPPPAIPPVPVPASPPPPPEAPKVVPVSVPVVMPAAMQVPQAAPAAPPQAAPAAPPQGL